MCIEAKHDATHLRRSPQEAEEAHQLTAQPRTWTSTAIRATLSAKYSTLNGRGRLRGRPKNGEW